jgi:hypothetical protein
MSKILRSTALKRACEIIEKQQSRRPDMPFMSDIDVPEETVLRCEDCGKPYSDPDWIDCTLPDDQWLKIHPGGEGGVLCGACMLKRISKLEHVTVIYMYID